MRHRAGGLVLALILLAGCEASAPQPPEAPAAKKDEPARDQAPTDDPPRKADPGKVKEGLKALAAGTGKWDTLTVTYDDRHPLHGGLTLTIKGTGEVKQQAVRAKTGEPKPAVTKEELAKLVELLIAREAWEQKVPDRPANADESKAKLTIDYGDATVTVWEWYNDLPANARLVKVRDRMTEIGWKSKPGK